MAVVASAPVCYDERNQISPMLWFSSIKNKILKKELGRKFFHLLQVLGIWLFVHISETYSHQTALLIAVAFFILFLKVEYLRVEYQMQMPKFFRWILRQKEESHYSGVIFFVIALIICFSIFDYPIALVALLFAAFGDFFSALFGIAFGKKKLIHNKTYVGFIAGLIANYVAGSVFLLDHPELLIPMVLTASFVEVITNKLDDNLTVPIFSGFVGQLIVMYFGISL